MPTTSNFGWTTPADTDLVKDGAAAIRTLGNGIDTSLVDLKGGTTGQNLRKASNTDLDFTFAGDATNTVIDAAGDLLYGTAADTLGRLAIGTAGQVLKVNAGATAPEWGAGGSSSLVKIVQTSFSAVASQAFDNCFSATYKHYIITLDGMYGSTTDADLLYQARTSAPATITTNYYGGTLKLTYNSTTPTNITHDAASAATLTQDVGSSANPCGGILFITVSTSNITSVSGFYTNGNSAITNSPNVATNGSGGNAGFLLSVSTGTMTGRATVYGVAE